MGASALAPTSASSIVCLELWHACAVVIGWSIDPDLKERSIEDPGFFWGLLRLCGQSVVVLRIRVFSYLFIFSVCFYFLSDKDLLVFFFIFLF